MHFAFTTEKGHIVPPYIMGCICERLQQDADRAAIANDLLRPYIPKADDDLLEITETFAECERRNELFAMKTKLKLPLLAVAAVIAPAVRADSVTQLHQIGPVSSWGPFGGGDAHLLYSESAAAGLASIDIAIDISASLYAFSPNGNGSTWTFTPGITWLSTLYLPPDLNYVAGFSGNRIGAPPVTLLDNQSHTFQTTFAESLAFSSTDPAVLAHFSALSPVIYVSFGWEANGVYFGHSGGEYNLGLALTYNYEAADGFAAPASFAFAGPVAAATPDTASALMLGLVVALLALYRKFT